MNDKKILDLHSTTDYLVYTWLIEGIAMKPGKVPCCMFLSASLGLTLHRTWQNSKGGYAGLCVFKQEKNKQPMEALRLCNIYLDRMSRVKDLPT